MLDRRKAEATAAAADHRAAKAQHEAAANTSKGRKQDAARIENRKKTELDTAKRDFEAAKNNEKDLNDRLEYLKSKESYDAAKKKNEEYVLTERESARYTELEAKLRREADAGLDSDAGEIKEFRYLERMAQWQKRSDRSFAGQNKDYWDGKRFTQYRFGGLELKEWIANAIPGGTLPEGADWAAKYGAAAIQVNVNLFNIRQATAPTAAEAEAQQMSAPSVRDDEGED